MTNSKCPHGSRIVTLALGLGVMIVAAQSGENSMAAKAASGPVRCEIQVEKLGSSVQLQGVVFANEAVQGAYEMQVSKSGVGGRSNINQAGGFDAGPHAPAKLGIVQLGGDNGTYRAKLKVTWNGEEIECEKKIGGWL
jgi:hypothetical protein